MASASNSGHGSAMFDIGQKSRAIALMVATILVVASTVVPSLSYAQKYGDHLSQYGGYDARASAISGFAALYLSPGAPMLPVILSTGADLEIEAVLPSACSMDKTVLPTGVHSPEPETKCLSFLLGQTHPTGIDHPTMRGPPRSIS